MRRLNFQSEVILACPTFFLKPGHTRRAKDRKEPAYFWSTYLGSVLPKKMSCGAYPRGLDETDALKCLTIKPAKLIGIADRVGSLEEGKDADIIILDGNPFD